MPKYSIGTTITISIFTEVEAENAAAALEEALNRSVISLCHQCGSGKHADQEWVTSGELDGEPREDGINIEELE